MGNERLNSSAAFLSDSVRRDRCVTANSVILSCVDSGNAVKGLTIAKSVVKPSSDVYMILLVFTFYQLLKYHTKTVGNIFLERISVRSHDYDIVL